MIEDFIGEFEKVVPDHICNKFIEYFGTLDSMNLVLDRPENGTEIKDRNVEIFQPKTISVFAGNPIFNEFMDIFWDCFKQYSEKYPILMKCGSLEVRVIKFQKTEKSSGYHVWHFENSKNPYRDRLVVWLLYLNDVEEGGETEFIYQSKRIKPKKGTLVFWPAGYTHTHRGNPPLSETKYVATSWIEQMS